MCFPEIRNVKGRGGSGGDEFFSGYIKSEVPRGYLRSRKLYRCACYLGEMGLGVDTLELESSEVKMGDCARKGWKINSPYRQKHIPIH